MNPNQAVIALAAEQDGVISRRQLYGLGVTRWQVVANLRAGRWQRIGDQSVCVHTGPLSQRAKHWAAVFQGGPRAQLDGASALIESGLVRFELGRVRVSVPRGAKVRRNRECDIRQTRRWSVADLAPSGVPRTRPEVAAVRAGLWARSDRQALLVVTMAVQQGITTAEDIGRQLIRVRRDRRRLLLHALVNDLLDGARSLGELEIGDELARRGLPRPDRQVLRKDRRGRYFLDLCWSEWKLVVEIDGIHHIWAENVVGDALRQNALVLDGDTVLRLPLLGLRLEPDEFLDQIEQALRAAGWRRDVIRSVA
jgi:very-short-patch-repair endonuclease